MSNRSMDLDGLKVTRHAEGRYRGEHELIGEGVPVSAERTERGILVRASCAKDGGYLLDFSQADVLKMAWLVLPPDVQGCIRGFLKEDRE